jgi:hypothetical protein
MRPIYHGIAAAAALAFGQPVESQTITAPAAVTYADLADLALAAPLVAHVRVERARALSEREMPTVPAGYRRFLVEAEVVSLIRGPAAVAQQIRYLADVPNEGGRAARIRRRTEFLVLGAPVPNRPGEIRLVAPDAQLPYDAATADRLRALLRESMAPNAAPRITGIGRAFSVPGSLPGESETQIFLQTADGRPISLNVLRRPGESPRWSVALSEIVDDAAAPPEPETLLWYRLACTLPPALPRQSLQEASADEARTITADYRLIKERLGPCARNRRPL